MTDSNSKLTAHLVLNTHWDREWYDTFRTYQLRLAEVVDAILDQLESGVIRAFTLDGQTSLLTDYLELRPGNAERIRQQVAQKTLSIGPWFVMPDEFLVGGESLIRNLQKGIAEAKAWGETTWTGYLPDTFGHSSDIPLIFHHAGITGALLWRGLHLPKADTMLWTHPSGATVVTYHLNQGYFHNLWHDPTLPAAERDAAWKTLAEALAGHASGPQILIPIGGDHLGPLTPDQKRQLDTALAANDAPWSKAIESTPARFIQAQEYWALNHQNELLTINGELTDNRSAFVLHGVYSSRIYLRQRNKALEHQITRIVEPLTTWAWAHAKALNIPFRYPEAELATAWRQLMLNHPHDSICGCSIDAVHRENEVRYDEVESILNGLTARATDFFGKALATPEQFWTMNLDTQPFTGVVRVREWSHDAAAPTRLAQVESEATVLQDAYRTDFLDVPQAHKTMTERHGWLWVNNVPGFGYQVLDTQQSKQLPPPAMAVRVEDRALENHAIRLSVNDDGTLTVLDKLTDQRYETMHQILDRPEQGDSYTHAPVPGSSYQFATLTGCRIVHCGPLVGELEVSYRLEETGDTLHTRIRLQAGSLQVHFTTEWTNTRPDHRLQVTFPTTEPLVEVVAETHFGTIRRLYNPSYRMEDDMPAEPWKELVPNTGPIQRFVLFESQMLTTIGLSEYEVTDFNLALTLLRGFGVLSKGDSGVRGAQAGPPFATPEGQCIKRLLSCQYIWQPRPATLPEAFHQASHAYGVVFGEQGRASKANAPVQQATGQWVNAGNPNLVLTALYKASNTLTARWLNPTPEPQPLLLDATFPHESPIPVNLLGEPQPQPEQGNNLAIGPCDLLTVTLPLRYNEAT